MDFFDVVRFRRSYRGYSKEQVSKEALNAIAEAVQLAPTACNRQPYKLLLIKNPALRAKICQVYQQKWLMDAPVIAVMLGNATQCWTRLEGDSIIDVDCAIAMEHFVLAAAAQKLGTCWICAFNREAMDQAVGIEKPWRAFAISPLGYPLENAVRSNSSKELNELIQVIE